MEKFLYKNKSEASSPKETERNIYGRNKQVIVADTMEIINNDRPGSQALINLDETAKIRLFLEKYKDPELFFQADNFKYLASLNSRDRFLAKSAMMTSKLPAGALDKYKNEFPEDEIIDEIGLDLFTSLENYSWEDNARIDNTQYDQVVNKLNEMGLFLDKALRSIKNDKKLLQEFQDSYKLFITSFKEDAKKLQKVINSSIFGKTLKFSEVFISLISRAESKLLDLSDSINSDNTQGNTAVLSSFNNDLIIDSSNRRQNIEELGKVAGELNNEYKKLGNELLSSLASVHDAEAVIINNENLHQVLADLGIDEHESLLQDFREHQKFSSLRLQEMMANYQNLIDAELFTPEIMLKVRKEYEDLQSIGDEDSLNNFNWSERAEKYVQTSLTQPSSEQILYEEMFSKLQNALPLQMALEKKMTEIIYGKEDLKLPHNFNNYENNIVDPEKIPEKAPLYFPVGISKDLFSWEQVLAGQKKFAKPIDLYGYLFWLNNQDREIQLIICDEIQVNNYVSRYNKDEESALASSQQIGNMEAEEYKKIINTFGLKNIKLIRYQEFINSKQEDFVKYRGLVDKLANQDVFKEAFLAMVQESVSGAEKEEYINYALEELAWILSSDGTKIGHLNEARYDILALVIKNVEKIAKDKNLDVFNNLDSAEAQILLNTVSKLISDKINEAKSKLDSSSATRSYYERLRMHLDKIKLNKKMGVDRSIKKEDLSLNFACPDVGSASFGFRNKGKEKESVIKFKEPYSTYFYNVPSDLLVNSDQVVALGDGLIAGKILTLDNEIQLKYAENVLKPILKHFFASLDKAPDAYFEAIDKNKNELIAEVKTATSLLSTLNFIQKYIVKPTQLTD